MSPCGASEASTHPDCTPTRPRKDRKHVLKGTLDNISQGITNVDAEGRIRVYNQRYLELLDLPESLLATQPLVEEVVRFQTERGDFGPNFQLIEPMARNYVASEYAAHGNQMPLPDSYVRRTPKGRYIEVRTRALEPGGRVRTFTDVTDYLSTLEALRQSEARWRSLTDLSSDWYWEQDDQFRFVRLDGNPYHTEGVPDEMHYGLTRWELPDTFVNEGQWREHREQLEAHQVFHDFEMQRLSQDGKPVWVSISGEPIFDEEGRFTGYRGVARDITERKLAEAEIQRLAFYDELTGLPNRRLLMDRLERAVATTQREGSHGALLFLDLDNFKDINDTMGHEWGDRLLVQVGMRIGASVRATDTVARLGGDEFVVVLQGLNAELPAAAAEAETVAQKMLTALNRPYSMQGSEVHSTPSIGIALFATCSCPCRSCCSAPTSPCTRPRPRAATRCAFSTLPCRRPPRPARRWKATCARACCATNSCCTTSRWSMKPARCWAPKRCCAGTTPSAAWCRPGISYRWPSRRASSCPWAGGCSPWPASSWRNGRQRPRLRSGPWP